MNLKGIIKNSGIVFAGSMVERILAFMSVMFLVRITSPENYGFYILLLSISELIIGLSNFNLNQAVIRYVNIKKYENQINKIVFNSFVIEVLVGLLSFVVLAIVLWNKYGIGHVSYLIPVYVLLFPLIRNSLSIFQAVQSFFLLSLIKIIMAVTFLFLVFIPHVSNVNATLDYLFFAKVLPVIISIICAIIFIYKLDLFSLTMSLYSKYWIKKLLSFSIFPFIQGSLSIIWRKLDFFLIAYFLTKQDVGFFKNGIILVTMFGMAMTSFSTSIFPKIVRYHSAGKDDYLKKNNELYIYAVLLLVLPFVSFVSMYSELIIPIVFTKSYLKSAEIFKYAILIYPFMAINNISVNWVIAMKKQKYWVGSALLVLIISLIIDLLLLPRFGLWGALISYLVSNLALFTYITLVSQLVTKTNVINLTFFINVFLFLIFNIIVNSVGSHSLFYICGYLISIVVLNASFILRIYNENV